MDAAEKDPGLEPSQLDSAPVTAIGPIMPVISYKTKMCRAVLHGGKCHYEKKCTFAHSPGELRYRAFNRLNPSYKTKLCQRMLSRGSCAYGSECVYVHPLPPLAVVPQPGLNPFLGYPPHPDFNPMGMAFGYMNPPAMNAGYANHSRMNLGYVPTHGSLVYDHTMQEAGCFSPGLFTEKQYRDHMEKRKKQSEEENQRAYQEIYAMIERVTSYYDKDNNGEANKGTNEVH